MTKKRIYVIMKQLTQCVENEGKIKVEMEVCAETAGMSVAPHGKLHKTCAKKTSMEKMNVNLEQAANYLIQLFYKTGKKYSCTRTKIGKLLSIVAFSYARKNSLCFNEKIFKYDECGTIINELEAHVDREIYLKCDYDNGKQMHTGLIDESFDEEAYLNKREGNLKYLNIHDIFDLGDLTIEIINLEGHTQGSVGFLIKELNILVTSDAICPFVWIFLKESTTFKVYKEMLKNTLNLNFDYFLVGHGAGKLLPKSRMEKFYQTALDLTIEKSVKVEFNNFDDANSYCYTKGKMYDQEDSGIVFDPNRME